MSAPRAAQGKGGGSTRSRQSSALHPASAVWGRRLQRTNQPGTEGAAWWIAHVANVPSWLAFCGAPWARQQQDRPARCKPLATAVREKVEAAEEHFMHPHTFVGPNPDEGSEGAK